MLTTPARGGCRRLLFLINTAVRLRLVPAPASGSVGTSTHTSRKASRRLHLSEVGLRFLRSRHIRRKRRFSRDGCPEGCCPARRRRRIVSSGPAHFGLQTALRCGNAVLEPLPSAAFFLAPPTPPAAVDRRVPPQIAPVGEDLLDELRDQTMQLVPRLAPRVQDGVPGKFFMLVGEDETNSRKEKRLSL